MRSRLAVIGVAGQQRMGSMPALMGERGNDVDQEAGIDGAVAVYDVSTELIGGHTKVLGQYDEISCGLAGDDASDAFCNRLDDGIVRGRERHATRTRGGDPEQT